MLGRREPVSESGSAEEIAPQAQRLGMALGAVMVEAVEDPREEPQGGGRRGVEYPFVTGFQTEVPA